MKEIIFVTGNKGKQASAQKYFDADSIKVSCFDYDIVEPTVNDIEAIALSKVSQAYSITNKPCISLDCGFYIPNYPGNPNFPGAFPKRELLEKLGIDGLLEKMTNVQDRTCYFKECLAYYDGDEFMLFFGISCGTLAKEKRGSDTEKKWSELWNVFIPDNCEKTLAEMTAEEREIRPDNHSSAIENFSHWYKNIKVKRL